MNSPAHATPKTYLWVAVALLLLLGATFGLAHLDLGPFNTPVALLIAAAKALLVALYFMHLRYSKGILRVAASTGIFWLGILVGLVLADYVSRDWLTLPSGWPQAILDTVRRDR